MKIAVLLTCHNRKAKTLKALASLFKAKDSTNIIFSITVYLTDDGSTDGTSKVVKEHFPETQILKGDGNLYWAEGMRNSWKKALEKEYDFYFLINDDTILYPNVFHQLFKTNEYNITQLEQHGICIGATQDNQNKLSYSASIILNKFLYTQKRLPPNGQQQKCDIGNANIMLVPKEVVSEIGILTAGYEHGMADYDYTLKANRSDIPVTLCAEYCGYCENDHGFYYENFHDKSFKERKKFLFSPNGLDFKSHYKYIKKFFPFRAPFVLFFAWFKLFFPKSYLLTLKLRGWK